MFDLTIILVSCFMTQWKLCCAWSLFCVFTALAIHSHLAVSRPNELKRRFVYGKKTEALLMLGIPMHLAGRVCACVRECRHVSMSEWMGVIERQTETDRQRVILTYLNEQANNAFQWGNKRLIQPKIFTQWYLQLKLQWANSISANISLQCLHKHKCLQGGSIDI